MNETIAKGFAGRPALFRSLPVAEFMKKSPHTRSRNQQQERQRQRTENFDEQSLRGHQNMIPEKRPVREQPQLCCVRRS